MVFFFRILATRCAHAVTRPRSSLPIASDLFFQSERLVSQVVLLFGQAADKTRQLSVLPEQPLRQGAGGASRQHGNTLRAANRKMMTHDGHRAFTKPIISHLALQFKASQTTDLGDRGQTRGLLQHADDLIHAGLHPGQVFTLHLDTVTGESGEGRLVTD